MPLRARRKGGAQTCALSSPESEAETGRTIGTSSVSEPTALSTLQARPAGVVMSGLERTEGRGAWPFGREAVCVPSVDTSGALPPGGPGEGLSRYVLPALEGWPVSGCTPPQLGSQTGGPSPTCSLVCGSHVQERSPALGQGEEQHACLRADRDSTPSTHQGSGVFRDKGHWAPHQHPKTCITPWAAHRIGARPCPWRARGVWVRPETVLEDAPPTPTTRMGLGPEGDRVTGSWPMRG